MEISRILTLPARGFPGRRLPSLMALFGESAAGRRAAERTAEDNLVERARCGDEESFRILVERYRHAAFAVALRIVRSREDAEEAAQDAFVRAWRALPQFRGDARFSTWLLRIVTRRALDQTATLRRRRERELVTAEGDVEALPDPASYRRPDRTRFRLERLVGELPEAQRAVITLYYLRDRSVDETAHILDLPPGTVKTHLHRARAALRRAWLKDTAREESDELRGL